MAFRPDEVAIICGDPMRSIEIATILRSDGITVETYLTGSVKKQFKRAENFHALIIVRDDGIFIKDMITHRQRPVVGDIRDAVRYVLDEGYYDDDGYIPHEPSANAEFAKAVEDGIEALKQAQ